LIRKDNCSANSKNCFQQCTTANCDCG